MFPLRPHTLITAYSIETILMGMNCILYAFCAYVLWGQTSTSCRLLLLISTVQFLLCAAQLILQTIFIFLIYTVIINVPAYLSRVNGYLVGSNIICTINFIITGILSIWRLYALYDDDIKVCVPSLLFWIAQICMSGLSIRNRATTPGFNVHYDVYNLLLWAFITAVNLCVAIPICVRLCIAQKKTHAVLSRSPYKSIVIVFIECSTLTTLCSIAIVVLHACQYTQGVISLGAATEVAVASQLLITARHAMLSHGTSGSSLMPLQPNVMHTGARSTDSADRVAGPTQVLPSLPEPDPEDNKSWQWSDEA